MFVYYRTLVGEEITALIIGALTGARISRVELPEPRIIPRPEHKVSRGNIDPDAVKVLYRLHRHGYLAYLVGGGVRDLELGKRPKDFDVGTDARPGQIRKLFRNSRIIGRRFRLVQVFFRGGKIIEVSTFRKAADPDDEEVLGANNTFGTPAEDAMRRDLTINALFYNIADFSVVDYVGGMADLKAGLIRGVGDADVRFHRDPVRILRAIRHAARAGFTLTDDTMAAVESHRDKLALCPPSRIRDELMRDLFGGASRSWLDWAHRTGVLYSLFPPLEPLYNGKQNSYRDRAGELMSHIDEAFKRNNLPEDAVALAVFLWPALERLSEEEAFPPGRQGRVAWSMFVRDNITRLAEPVQFPKRMLERARQIGGVMGFLKETDPGLRLPKKLVTKGYFDSACELAKILGGDLRSMAGSPAAGAKKRRPRRRPRRRRKKPAQNNSQQAKPRTEA